MPNGIGLADCTAHVLAYREACGLCLACGAQPRRFPYGSFCEDCTALSYHRAVGSTFHEPERDGHGRETPRTRTHRILHPETALKLAREN